MFSYENFGGGGVPVLLTSRGGRPEACPKLTSGRLVSFQVLL